MGIETFQTSRSVTWTRWNKSAGCFSYAAKVLQGKAGEQDVVCLIGVLKAYEELELLVGKWRVNLNGSYVHPLREAGRPTSFEG